MKRTFNAHSGNYYIFQNVRFTLNMLLDVRKTWVNEHTVNMRYSIHACCTFSFILLCNIVRGEAVAEWLSSWLAEQENRGSIPGLAT